MGETIIVPSGQAFTWQDHREIDFLKIDHAPGNSLSINGGASGWISELEIDHYSSGDPIRVGQSFTSGGPCTIGQPVGTTGAGGGYVWIHDRPDSTAHQDGCQAGGGIDVGFWNLVFRTTSPNGSTQGFIAQGFSGGHPTRVGYDHCVIGPDSSGVTGWATGVNLGASADYCYARNCYCANVKNGASNQFSKDAGSTHILENNQAVTNSNSVMSYSMSNLRVPWLAAGAGGGTFPRTAQRQRIVIRSSLKALTRDRTVQREHGESHSVILGGGGLDINRPRQADRLPDVITVPTVELTRARTAERLPDVTRSYALGGVTYTQWTAPWSSTEVNAGCAVTIGLNNRVQAYTYRATTGDISRALQTGSQYFPGAYVKGRLRFRFTGKENIYGSSQQIFAIKAGTPSVFRLYFDSAGDRVTAAAARMGGGASALTVTDILGSSPVVGQTYLVEWKLDRRTDGPQAYEIKVDGGVVASGTPAAGSTVDQITQFWAGFTDASNPDGVLLGVTVEVWDIVLASADVALPDEPAAGGTVEGAGVILAEVEAAGPLSLTGSGSV